MRRVPAVETERLVLRAFALTDFDAWRAGYRDRQPAGHAYDRGPIAESCLTMSDFAERVARFERWAAADETYVWGVFERSSARHVGTIDVDVYNRGDRDWANIGFFIHNTDQRRGLAREALRAVLGACHATLDFQRIEAATRPDNAPAIAVCRSAGMIEEGVRRRFWKDPDGWADHAIFASIRGLEAPA